MVANSTHNSRPNHHQCFSTALLILAHEIPKNRTKSPACLISLGCNVSAPSMVECNKELSNPPIQPLSFSFLIISFPSIFSAHFFSLVSYLNINHYQSCYRRREIFAFIASNVQQRLLLVILLSILLLLFIIIIVYR